MRLTAKERILLHLLDYAKFSDAVEVPWEMTQDGLARAGGFELRHASQYVRPLLREDLLRERTSHVKGSRQRRKVYELTTSGRGAAIRLRERVKDEPVVVRGKEAEQLMTIGKAFDLAEGRLTLSDLVRNSLEGGVLDLGRTVREVGQPGLVEMLGNAPRVDEFVGRREELETVTGGDPAARLFVVRGVAGIGKSSFGAKVCGLLHGKRNLYWHDIRPWDTRLSLLAGLSEFLADLGRPGLKAVLSRGDSGQTAQVLRADFPGTNSVLLFDDAHEAGPEAIQFLRLLKEAVSEAEDVRAIVLTRRALPFYDRRDVAVRGRIREIELTGLSTQDIAALPDARLAIVPSELRRVGGHPLLLALLRAAPHPVQGGQIARDMNRFIEEAIYSELSEAERTTLKVASAYRVPVPEEAFFASPAVSHDVIVSLTNRALILPRGDEGLQVHDTVRDFFDHILTPDERKSLSVFARGQLCILADRSRAEGDLGARGDFLSNALRLATEPRDRSELLEQLGDIREKGGDLPGALAAYREAGKLDSDKETAARIHRKTASAFEVRGDAESAAREVAAGMLALGEHRSRERGWLLLLQCGVADRLEQWSAARDAGRAALEIFREGGDLPGQAQAFLRLGDIEIEAPESNPARAEAYFRDALRLAELLRDDEVTAKVRTTMAHFYAYRLGDLDRAMEQMGAIGTLLETTRDLQSKRSFLMLKGWFTLELEANYEAAEAYFAEVSTLGRRLYDAVSVAFAKYGLALSTYFHGRIAEARTAFDDFGREIHSLGYPAFGAEALWMVAESSLRLGDLDGFQRAASAFRDPALAEGVKVRPVHAKVLDGIEAASVADEISCRKAFDEALRVAQAGFAIEETSLLHFVHAFYGICLRALGREREGTEQIRQATELLKTYHLKARLSILGDAEREVLHTLTSQASGTR